ncbi:MAG: hypothetical protein GF399_01775 [Candidatus Coatesbacteria bacterium]|nr:hypothetical protein [Candidatus Coatesbacteria bacterium]
MNPQELFNISSLTRFARRRARSFGIRVLFALGAACIIGAGNIVYFSLREGWFGQTSLTLAGACLIPAAAFIGLALDAHRRRVRQIYKALTGWTTALLLPGLSLSTWLIYPGQWPAWASLALTATAVIYLGLLFAGRARRSRHHHQHPGDDDPPADYPDYDELEEYPLDDNDER